jgi:hypothetical protein
MIWTAWNNGQHTQSGAGYGIKVDASDRDAKFERSWQTVVVELYGEPTPVLAEANVGKPSFWGPTCRELICQDIGRWLIAQGFAPWTKGSPPKFEVEAAGDRRFRIIRPVAF